MKNTLLLTSFVFLFFGKLTAQPPWFFVEESQVAAYYKDFKRAIDQMEMAIKLDSGALHRTHWFKLAQWHQYRKDTAQSFEAMKVAIDQGIATTHPSSAKGLFRRMGFVDIQESQSYLRAFITQSQAYVSNFDSTLMRRILGLSKPIEAIDWKLFTLRRDLEIVSGLLFDSLMQEKVALQKLALADFQKIIDQFGWPGYSLVGLEASSAAKEIAIKGDSSYLKYCLPMFRKSVNNYNGNRRDLAYMEDRLLFLRELPLKYGIHYSSGKENKTMKMNPVDDWVKINRRRILAGMEIIWWRDGYETF